MAVKLDTSRGTESVKAQARREADFKFKLAKIALVVLAVGSLGMSVKTAVSGYQEMQASAKEVEVLEQKRDSVAADIERQKAEQAKAEEERLAEQGSGKVTGEDGSTVIQRPMYSAKAAGEELAAIQTLLSNDKKILLDEEKARLTELAGSSASWWGSSVQRGVPLEWEFLTFYDANRKNYDCVWACWHQGTNSRYLAAIKFGKYDGETDRFAMDTTLYKTTFADMLDNLEDPSVTTIDAGRGDIDDGGVNQMLGELTGTETETEAGTEGETGTESEAGTEGETGTEAGTGDGGGSDVDGFGADGLLEGEPETAEPDVGG